MQRALQVERALRRHHAALRRQQQLVFEDVAQPGEPCRQRRLTEVQPPGSTGHVPLGKQRVQRHKQLQIEPVCIHAVYTSPSKFRFQDRPPRRHFLVRGKLTRNTTMSNILIVHAHPEPKSLTSALKDLAVERLGAHGHAVKVSDLYAAGWKAVADRGDFLEATQPDRLSYIAE